MVKLSKLYFKPFSREGRNGLTFIKVRIEKNPNNKALWGLGFLLLNVGFCVYWGIPQNLPSSQDLDNFFKDKSRYVIES